MSQELANPETRIIALLRPVEAALPRDNSWFLYTALS
jgi:hypothetical protein